MLMLLDWILEEVLYTEVGGFESEHFGNSFFLITLSLRFVRLKLMAKFSARELG